MKEPENTLRAYEQAFVDGANAIEIDARLCKDGRVVVLHDESVDRTTDGSGYVRDFTIAELKRLDAGKGERIPTLEEVIDFTKGKGCVLIDMKEDGLEGEIARVIEDYSAEDRVIVSTSGWIWAGKKITETNSKITVALWFSDPRIDMIELKVAFLGRTPEFIHGGDCRNVTPRIVERVHKRGSRLILGTVPPERLRDFVEMGVDGITTKDSLALSKILASHNNEQVRK